MIATGPYYIPSVKITPPSLDILEDTIEREKLIGKTLDSLKGRMTLIYGGAGMGKTVLLAQVAARAGKDIYWVNVDRDDSDLLNFTHLLLNAVQRRNPDAGGTLTRFLAETISAGEKTKTVAGLLSDIFLSVNPFLLVIDDFHLLTQKSEIEALIGYLVELLPEDRHMILTSRRPFDFDGLTKWKAKRWVCEIDETDLLMTVDDIQSLLRTWRIPKPHVILSSRLHRLTNGWIGIIVLLMERWRHLTNGDRYLSELDGMRDKSLLIEYLIREIVGDLPEEYQDFILVTSLFQRLIPADIDRFLKRRDSGSVLDELSRSSRFIARISGDAPEYKYHALLGEWAYQTLEKRSGAEETNRLHRRLAVQLKESGDFIGAVNHFTNASAYEEAVEVLVQNIGKAHKAYEITIIRMKIEDIPGERIEKHPELLLMKSRTEFGRGKAADALRLADRAIKAFLERGAKSGAMEAYTHKAYMLQSITRYDELKITCEEALSCTGDEITRLRFDIEKFLHMCPGNFKLERLRETMEKSVELAAAENDYLAVAVEMVNLAIAYYAQVGRLEHACEIIERQMPVYEKYGQVVGLCISYQHLGLTQFVLGRLDKAELSFNRMMLLSEQYGLEFHEFTSIVHLSIIYSEQKLFDEALDLLKQAEKYLTDLPQHLRLNRHYAEAFRIYWTMRGDEQQAVRYAEKVLELERETKSEDHLAQALRCKGETMAELKRWREAEQCLLEAHDLFERQGKPFRKAKTLYTLALRLLYDRTKDYEKYLGYLRRALKASRKYRFDFIFLNRSAEQNVALLAIALEEKIEPDYVAGLLARIGDHSLLFPLVDHSDPGVLRTAVQALETRGRINEVLPRIVDLADRGDAAFKKLANGILERSRSKPAQPLEIQCFGEFRVWVGSRDRPVGNEAWIVKRAKKLFKYLLIQRRQPVHQEILVDLFWPDSDLKRGLNSLQRAIGFLRKALQPELTRGSYSQYITFHENHYTLILPEGSDVDYDRFSEAIASAKAALAEGNLSQSHKKFDSASGIYSGEFLGEDMYESWLLSIRQGFRMDFTNLGLRLSERMLQSGFTRDALDIARKVKDLDPFNEDVAASMMKAHHRAGYPSLAMQVYSQFRELLAKELDMEPSDYIRDLSQRIMRYTAE